MALHIKKSLSCIVDNYQLNSFRDFRFCRVKIIVSRKTQKKRNILLTYCRYEMMQQKIRIFDNFKVA